MPRPLKVGLMYFPLDTDFFTNKKIKALRRSHGSIGILTYLNLLSRVYRNGYYYTFDDIDELAMDIAEEIACEQLRKTANGVAATINYLVKQGILDEGLFEQGVISGVALQEQYAESARKAKWNTKMEAYCLIGSNVSAQKNNVSSEETAVTSEVTVVISEESTLNKIKENNINIFTTTTARAQGDTASNSDLFPPCNTEVFVYFRDTYCLNNAADEAITFCAYNAKRGWDCLPDWKLAADLWVARINAKNCRYNGGNA